MTKAQLFEEYSRTKDVRIRNEIVESHLYLVDILIRKYLNKGVDYDDLYQVGAMALVTAVDRFDSSKGFEFSTFATPTILGEIKKYFRDKVWSLKVPRRLKEINARIPAAKDVLFAKLQRKPTVPELAQYLGYSEEEVLQAMESGKAYGTYSLNQTFDDFGEEGDNPILEKYTMTEDRGYESLEYAEIIRTVLNRMSDREQQIFKKRFIQNKTQMDAASDLGVSQMTVSRMEREIKKKFNDEIRRSVV